MLIFSIFDFIGVWISPTWPNWNIDECHTDNTLDFKIHPKVENVCLNGNF